MPGPGPALSSGWEVARERADPGWLHGGGLPVPDRRRVRVAEATRPAVVLGSAQRPPDGAEASARARGLDLVRRRSGGGAVLVVPGDLVWLDVTIPRDDPLWVDDVAEGARFVATAAAAAVRALGVPAAEPWAGRFTPSPWSSAVCFAGRAPGEVVVGGRKLVGTSQRRTREGAVLQIALLLRWDPAPLLDVLQLPDEAAEDLATTAVGLVELAPAATGEAVVDAVVEALRAAAT